MEQWIVGKPGGPAGPFWSIVSSSGRVIAMQIPDEKIAREIVALRAQRDDLRSQLDAAWRRADYWSAGYTNLTKEYSQEREGWLKAQQQLEAAQAELHELRIRAGRRRSGEPQRGRP